MHTNVMHFNHPQAAPPPASWKHSLHEPVPDAKKVSPCFRNLLQFHSPDGWQF